MGQPGRPRAPPPPLAVCSGGCLRRAPAPSPAGPLRHLIPPLQALSPPLPKGRLHLSPSVGRPWGPPPAEQAVPLPWASVGMAVQLPFGGSPGGTPYTPPWCDSWDVSVGQGEVSSVMTVSQTHPRKGADFDPKQWLLGTEPQ